MKKLLLTLSLILSVMALSAQKFTVTEKETGNVVENGATFYIYGDVVTTWYELILDLSVTANEGVSLIAEKETTDVVEGTSNMICLGMCYAPTVNVTPAWPFTAGESADFAMHYQVNDLEAALGQEQYIVLSLYEEGNPEDRFFVYVTFKYSLDGIENTSAVNEFSNAYPMPARDVVNFDYSFNESVDAQIAIYNMMGQEVLRNEINGMSGKASINVSDLADGIYFYSLVVNGVVEKSNKLVVRR